MMTGANQDSDSATRRQPETTKWQHWRANHVVVLASEARDAHARMLARSENVKASAGWSCATKAKIEEWKGDQRCSFWCK